MSESDRTDEPPDPAAPLLQRLGRLGIGVAAVFVLLTQLVALFRADSVRGVLGVVLATAVWTWLLLRLRARSANPSRGTDVRFLRTSALGFAVILVGYLALIVWAVAVGEFRARSLIFAGFVVLLLFSELLGIRLAPKIEAMQAEQRRRDGD